MGFGGLCFDRCVGDMKGEVKCKCMRADKPKKSSESSKKSGVHGSDLQMEIGDYTVIVIN